MVRSTRTSSPGVKSAAGSIVGRPARSVSPLLDAKPSVGTATGFACRRAVGPIVSAVAVNRLSPAPGALAPAVGVVLEASVERGRGAVATMLEREFAALLALAKSNGRSADPVFRQELARTYSTLEIMRYNNLRMLTVVDSGGVPGPEMSIGKLYWSNWHRSLGELMMLARGTTALVADETGHGDGYLLDSFQRTFLYSRAHTIYAGSNEVQRNVLGERVLGLPREPR